MEVMMPANDNRTHIYRIRRKSDGKFLTSAPCRVPGYRAPFDSVGCFWRKQETIREHLLALCQFWMYCGEVGHVHRPSQLMRKYEPDAPWLQIWPIGSYTKHLVSTNFNKLDLYEVVATEITVHGENVMEARAFASFMNDEVAYG
jgi:hypothetical protein